MSLGHAWPSGYGGGHTLGPLDAGSTHSVLCFSRRRLPAAVVDERGPDWVGGNVVVDRDASIAGVHQTCCLSRQTAIFVDDKASA